MDGRRSRAFWGPTTQVAKRCFTAAIWLPPEDPQALAHHRNELLAEVDVSDARKLCRGQPMP
jgi:hypothetical protein